MGRREERGGPEPPSDGKSSKLNFKGQSLGISQAAVRGKEHHHPTMDKLGGPVGQTYRQTDRQLHLYKLVLYIELVVLIPPQNMFTMVRHILEVENIA